MPQTASAQQRKQLRQHLRQTRRQLSRKQQTQHARAISKNLHNCRLYQQVKRVAFYLAEDGEIDTRFLIEKAWRDGKQVYLPVLSPYSDSLFFAPYTVHSRMKANRFGIAEPATPLRQCLHAHQLQLLCMPLVGFDFAGNRLGMGGGFYDRTLHFRQHQQQWKKPKLIGLAHECQRLDAIPVDSWDVPLDGLLTEKHYYRFK